MADEKTLDKIRAILRKAEDVEGASDNERAVAMRAAQALLIKHGLSMRDVGDLNDSSDDRRFVHGKTDLVTMGPDETWKGDLLFRIGRVYFCTVYQVSFGNGKSGWRIVGRKMYADAVLLMHQFIWPQIQRELNNQIVLMKQNPRYARVYAESVWGQERPLFQLSDIDDDTLAEVACNRFERIREEDGAQAALEDIMANTGLTASYASEVRPFIRREQIAPAITHNIGVWRRSFLDAAVQRVSGRLKQMRQEELDAADEANTSSGKELVLFEEKAKDAFLESLDLGLQSSASERRADYNGMAAGYGAGSRADLSGHNKVGGSQRALGAGA